jgi:hypothetical protein
MSVRSGVFPKYIIEFVDANFKVSNDISAGDFLIDADIKVTMARDTEGTKFTITLYNLPQDKATDLENALKPKTYQKLSIKLGYFETKVQLVVNGIYQKVESKVAADSSSGQNRLVTTITGNENALVACSDAKFTRSLSAAEASTYATAAFGVLKEIGSDKNTEDHPGIEKLVNTFVPIVKAGLPSGTSDTKFNNNTVLSVLSEIANSKQAKAELLIADGMVFLGSPIQYDRADVGPAQLDPSANLATFGKVKLKVTPKTPGQPKTASDKPKTPSGKPDPNVEKEISAAGFNFTALGDPTMRPGQEIVVSGIQTIVVNGKKDFDSSLEYRIRNVEHQFNATTGYVCVGAAAEAQTNGAAGRDIDSQLKATAAGAATDVASAIKSEAAKNPVVEVTAVKAAAADNKNHPYQVDLYYGQQRADEQQPSIEVAINAQPDHVYTNRPIASPFAWRKCGLVTPVYPTMKALVAHNLGLAADGIVTGYTWSTLPDLPPPTNEPGDWWLCLPISVDLTSLPPDQTKSADGSAFDWKKFDWSNFDKTKAVNDLTASNGCRVIELKGLKITVGADRLKEIGTRPAPGDAEQCTIAHASGAVITIKKAEIDVDTGSGPKLTLSSSGITLTDGKLNVQLANGKLAIG